MSCERPPVMPSRAAGGRWRAGAIAALQMSASNRTRHQIKGRAARPCTYSEDFALTFFQTEGRLRTRKPSIHAVVAVPSVVAVQNTTPRGTSPADALPSCPAAGCWHRCRWPGTLTAGTPPVLGPSTPRASTGNSNRVFSLARGLVKSPNCSPMDS